VSNASKDLFVSAMKEWASPVLMGLIGMLVWRDMSELRSDVKLMLSQNSRDEVRLSVLEAEMAAIKQIFYDRARSGASPSPHQMRHTSSSRTYYIRARYE
jgi:hypothetical protein